MYVISLAWVYSVMFIVFVRVSKSELCLWGQIMVSQMSRFSTTCITR